MFEFEFSFCPRQLAVDYVACFCPPLPGMDSYNFRFYSPFVLAFKNQCPSIAANPAARPVLSSFLRERFPVKKFGPPPGLTHLKNFPFGCAGLGCGYPPSVHMGFRSPLRTFPFFHRRVFFLTQLRPFVFTSPRFFFAAFFFQFH